MKVLIVEDEALARERLSELIDQYDDKIEIAGSFDSIEDTVNFFNGDSEIDLAFFDIQLSDGNSFEIFQKAGIDLPVIFTTAFDDFAIRAFKVNSVDYLLKPISFEDLSCAIEKYKKQSMKITGQIDVESIKSLIAVQSRQYKKRFLVKFGDQLQYKNATEAGIFYADGKIVYIVTRKIGRKYIIDHTLDELDSHLLDPDYFFRINRKAIINIDTIVDVKSYFNSRLKLTLDTTNPFELIVSRDKVSAFKRWLNQ
jgi:DNA-binding LytR/AlgR family response regulator